MMGRWGPAEDGLFLLEQLALGWGTLPAGSAVIRRDKAFGLTQKLLTCIFSPSTTDLAISPEDRVP